jgi:hypothetical protein
MPEPDSQPFPCPICGGATERGCLYGGDSGSGLRWLPGPASLGNNVWSSIGEGNPVGTVGFLAGTYAEGVHCPACRKVILNDQPGA